MPHVHIGHHFFGAGNIGDDWTIAGFLAAMDAIPAGARLTCCTSHDREAMRLRFPRVEWLEYGPASRAQMISEADAWLGLSDTPFQLDTGG